MSFVTASIFRQHPYNCSRSLDCGSCLSQIDKNRQTTNKTYLSHLPSLGCQHLTWVPPVSYTHPRLCLGYELCEEIGETWGFPFTNTSVIRNRVPWGQGQQVTSVVWFWLMFLETELSACSPAFPLPLCTICFLPEPCRGRRLLPAPGSPDQGTYAWHKYIHVLTWITVNTLGWWKLNLQLTSLS